jgi:hypothetical protein
LAKGTKTDDKVMDKDVRMKFRTVLGGLLVILEMILLLLELKKIEAEMRF